MTEPTITDWLHPEDEVWGDRLLLLLVVTHSVSGDQAHRAVGEARDACRESGRRAVDLFGEPDAYAHEVTLQQVPASERAAVDLEGTSPRDRWSLVVLGTGWLGGLASIVLMVIHGWAVPITAGGVAVAVGALLAWTGTQWGLLDRRAGHLRRGWVWWIASAAVVVVAATVAVSRAEDPPLGHVPGLLLLALAAGTVIVELVRPTTPATPPVDAPLTPDAWFALLAGLLRGRHYLPRTTVAHYVADARSHWADTGAAHPADEFGTPQVYALQLLEGSLEPVRGKALITASIYATVTVGWAVSLTTSVLGDAGAGRIAWLALGIVLFGSSAFSAWQRYRNPAGDTGKPDDDAA